MTRTTIETADGAFSAWFTERGLAALSFPGARPAQVNDAEVPGDWKRTTAEALSTLLDGKQPNSLPPLDISRGTDFQQKVWNALLRIGAGKTRTYGEVAAMIGMPGAARAVGAACGANSIPVLIPCHRVLAANRRIGGFSAGLKWKRLLLEREGVAVAGSEKAALSGRTQHGRWRNGQLTLGKCFA